MTLINFSLLTGLLLAAIPVVLHMVMRARPKRIEFPALRLLKSRQPSNARRMRLRHWLLLLVRSLLIAAVVLAVTRPSLPAARYGLRWWEWATWICVVVACVGVYQWLVRRATRAETAVHRLRDKRSRLRVLCVACAVLGSLLGVGVPWGIRVRAELMAPRNEATEDIPVAVVMVFDTSLSMNYRFENLTRLEKAQQVAVEYLSQLPSGSRVAVAGLDRNEEVVFQADLAGARSRMESLELTAVPDSINARIRNAVQSQVDDRQRVREDLGTTTEGDLFAREICVLTDSSVAAWKIPDESGLADLLKQNDWLQIYVIDVGVAQPSNVSLSNLRLSEETSAAGRPLQLNVTVASTAAASPNAIVETFLLNETGVEIRAGAPRTVRIETGAAEVSIPLQVPEGRSYAQGYVRLAASDPFAEDSIRYFSFGVRPRPRVLLISDRLEESYYLKNVLQPDEADRLGWQFYDCTRITTTQSSQYSFANFDVVCVLNSGDPGAAFWTALRRFAESGGGVFVTAGSNSIQADKWRTSDSRELLPALPIRPVPLRQGGDPSTLVVKLDQHPITRPFATDEDWRNELSHALFDRCWAVEVPAGTSSVLMSFTGVNDRPALLDRAVGSGRCLLWTSALDNLASGGSQWNNLVVENWAFLPLADSIMQYLTGASDQPRNFTAGQAIEIQVPASQRFSQYLLRRPGFRQTHGELPLDQSSVLLTDANQPGHYLIRPLESASPFESAFSVNMKDEESNLARITAEELNQILGPDRYARVTSPEDLQQVVRVGRLGIEVFPVLMGLVVLLFVAEHLMANYFYDEQAPQTPPTLKGQNAA